MELPEYTVCRSMEGDKEHKVEGPSITEQERRHFESIIKKLTESNLPYSCRQDIILNWIGPQQSWTPYFDLDDES